jgi:hypothetical protein
MAGSGDKRAGRRFGRRPALLVALGLVSSLGAGGAFAAVVVSRSAPGKPGRPLVVRVAPASRTVSAGDSATYTVRVARFNQRPIGLSGRTELSVRDRGLPAGADTSFASAPGGPGLARRATTTLTVTTSSETPAGTYRFRLRADRPRRNGGAAVELTVSRPPSAGLPAPGGPVAVEPPVAAPVTPTEPPVVAPDAFTIAGVLPDRLTPGSGGPLNLTLTNLESSDLLITSLDVGVATVSGPQADPTHSCDPADFAVAQFSGTPGFTLPASSSADLDELGFEPSEWPQVSMLNLSVNQDGCKEAALSLSFSGTATEVTP